MTEDKPADTPAIPPEIRDLLGPAPVLSIEDANRYERALDRFAQCVQPRDAIEWMLVRDLADERWEIERLRRFKHELIEEAYGAKSGAHDRGHRGRFRGRGLGPMCNLPLGLLT